MYLAMCKLAKFLTAPNLHPYVKRKTLPITPANYNVDRGNNKGLFIYELIREMLATIRSEFSSSLI